jgi:hypothetical protein
MVIFGAYFPATGDANCQASVWVFLSELVAVEGLDWCVKAWPSLDKDNLYGSVYS